MDIRAYVSLEAKLAYRLRRQWARFAKPIYLTIREAIERKDFDAARRQVPLLDMTDIGLQNKEYIRYLLLATANFGASLANRRGPTFTAVGEYRETMDVVVSTFCQYLEHGATRQVQTQALQLIAEAEAREVAQKRDTKRRPLYVCRKLLNAQEVIDWAKDAGFDTVIEPKELHVTVVYSKDPIDWMAAGDSFDRYQNSNGKRSLKQFGDAVVLAFESKELQKRWREFRDVGASWDYENYTPHITLTYNKPEGLVLSKVKPFEGVLKFGPEVYEDIDSEKDFVEKADRFVKDFVSFDKAGDQALQLISSLHSSRLSTWGFTAEAQFLGYTKYRLTAVLDGRTSDFCRWIDGKEFNVVDARQKIVQVLRAQDPEDLKTLQPWPDQSKAGMERLMSMSLEELVTHGWHIPPYHPHCRTMCVAVGKHSPPPPRLEAPPSLGQPKVPVDSSAFAELGISVTPRELDHWNAYIGKSPVEMLHGLTGVNPLDILKGALGTVPVKFPSNGDLKFDWKQNLSPNTTMRAGSVFDPFSGRMYLTRAEFETDPGADAEAARFLHRLMGHVVATGVQVGASTIVVGTAGTAYQYAQIGFTPSAVEWQTVRLILLEKLRSELKPIYDALTPPQQGLLTNLLSNAHEQAFLVLADLPWVVEGKPIGRWLLSSVDGQLELDLTDPNTLLRAKEALA